MKRTGLALLLSLVLSWPALAQPLDDHGDLVQRHAAQLDVLAGGDVRLAMPELGRHARDRARLAGGEPATTDAEPHHEGAGALRPVEHAVPLHPLQVVVRDVRDRGELARVPEQVRPDVQPVLQIGRAHV